MRWPLRLPQFRPPQPAAPPPPPPSLFDALVLPGHTLHAALGALALLIGLFLHCRRRHHRPERFNRVAGALPLLGNAHQLGRMQNFSKRLESWLDEYGGDEGVCECDIMGVRYVLVGGVTPILELMRQRPDRLRRAKAFGPLVRDGIDSVLTAEGKLWRAQRRVFSPAFSHNHMQGYLPAIKCVAKRLVAKWENGPGCCEWGGKHPGQPINRDFSCVAADVISLIAFTFDFDSLRSKVLFSPFSSSCPLWFLLYPSPRFPPVPRPRAACTATQIHGATPCPPSPHLGYHSWTQCTLCAYTNIHTR
eukprot:scaffold91482_cov33-Tisochrysis_lutea.AAC.4